MISIGKKIVIIINGKAASGKDTICDIIAKYYNAIAISEITPIKELAKLAGWNGEKDDKSRKMLADLKALFVAYNDLPLKYSMQKITEFVNSKYEILFIHIREKEEILKVVKNSPIKVYTLFVKRLDEGYINRSYGNVADDGVEDYKYDFYYLGNNKTKSDLEKSFLSFFENNVLSKI